MGKGKEIKVGCGSSNNQDNTKDIIKEEKNINLKLTKEEPKMIKVGKPAPLFTAQAFHEGKFTEVSLEDYKGKWVLLCFYPGDFTFV